jgi:hypothetical protein
MFMKTVLAFVLFGIAGSGPADGKPDLSGEWILNRQASTLSRFAGAVESGVWQIEHRDPKFRHKATLVTAGKPFSYEYELTSDGHEAVASQRGARVVSVMRWEGNTLVFSSRTECPDGESRVTFRFDLIDAGHLRATEQVRGTDRDQDNVWLFDRRERP